MLLASSHEHVMRDTSSAAANTGYSRKLYIQSSSDSAACFLSPCTRIHDSQSHMLHHVRHLGGSYEGYVVCMDRLPQLIRALHVQGCQVGTQHIDALLCQAGQVALQIKASVLKSRQAAEPDAGCRCPQTYI